MENKNICFKINTKLERKYEIQLLPRRKYLKGISSKRLLSGIQTAITAHNTLES